MKKYKFIIRKIAKREIKIKAQSEKEAYEKIIEFLAIGERVLFKNLSKNDDIYEIKMQRVESKQLENDKKKVKKIVDKIIEPLEKDLRKCEKNNKEIIDDLPKKYDEIVCENCGNYILLEKDLLS